jgi:hypothetical protein
VSRWWSEPAALGVSAEGVAWQRSRDAALEDRTAANREALSAAAGEAIHMLADSGGKRLRIVFADDLACHWITSPPEGLQSLAELRAVAELRCAELFGDGPKDWLVSGDWQAGRPFVCAAVPRGLAEVLADECARRGLRCERRTALACALQDGAGSLNDDGWTCIRSPRTLSLMHAARGRPRLLRILRQPVDASAQRVTQNAAQALHLEAARSGTPAGEHIRWLDAAPPDGSATWFADGLRFEAAPWIDTGSTPPATEAHYAVALARRGDTEAQEAGR